MLDDKELRKRLYNVLRQKGLSHRERGAIEMALHYGESVDGAMAMFHGAGEDVFVRGDRYAHAGGISEKDGGLAMTIGIRDEPPCVPAINSEVTRKPRAPGEIYPLSF